MKKVLLTSTGFDNENIKNKFLSLLEKEVADVKILFIITAANNPDSVRILSACLDDLTKCNIQDKNITVYDMHKALSEKEINKYDAIYVCGGTTSYLSERMNEISFQDVLSKYLENGGIYIGVSAGSKVFSSGTQYGLGLLENELDVHCKIGSDNGIIKDNQPIYLTDNQAVYISQKEKIIFE